MKKSAFRSQTYSQFWIPETRKTKNMSNKDSTKRPGVNFTCSRRVCNFCFVWDTSRITQIRYKFCGNRGKFVCLMVFNATFNNISVISWRSALLVEGTGGPGENHRPVASQWQTVSHTFRPDRDSNSQHLHCIGSCKCNYNTITAMTAPIEERKKIYIQRETIHLTFE